jgi:hypothetical protein
MSLLGSSPHSRADDLHLIRWQLSQRPAAPKLNGAEVSCVVVNKLHPHRMNAQSFTQPTC